MSNTDCKADKSSKGLVASGRTVYLQQRYDDVAFSFSKLVLSLSKFSTSQPVQSGSPRRHPPDPPVQIVRPPPGPRRKPHEGLGAVKEPQGLLLHPGGKKRGIA